MTTENMEALKQSIAELTNAVREGNKDPGTFDFEARAPEFMAMQQQLNELQAKLADPPARKGDPVHAHSIEENAPALKGNRYERMLKDIGKDGVHRDWLGYEHKAADLWMTNEILRKGQVLFPDRFEAGPSDDLEKALKALSSTGSGTGDELVPTNMAAELWEDVHLSNVLVSNLQRIPMLSNPMQVPNALGDITFRKGTENVAYTSTDPATSNQNLTVTELGGEVDWSYTLDEDAIVAIMPEVRRTIARNAAEYMDGFALNADGTTAATGNINSASAAPAADSYYLADGQDGIRHQWIVDNASQVTTASAYLTDAHVTTTLRKMGKYAVDPRQVLIVSDVYTYFRGWLNATTTNSPGTFLKSIADVGYSVIATGQVAMYRGMPIVMPVYAVLTASTGKVATSANSTGQVSFLNRSQWRVGFKRDLLVEVDRDIQKRQMILVVSFREAIGCRGTRSSNTHTAGILNITVT